VNPGLDAPPCKYVCYKTAWDKLKKEYGQTKLVVNAHVDEIVNLAVVKGHNCMKIQEFYEALSRNYGALLTLGEADMLEGFVMTTVNKLPQVKPDLVRTDDNWENWDMAALIDEIRKWLSRHKVDQGKLERKDLGLHQREVVTKHMSS
jgi:hypothetical protein